MSAQRDRGTGSRRAWRNAEAIAANVRGIAVLQEAMANLAGQHAEHTRQHDEALASR